MGNLLSEGHPIFIDFEASSLNEGSYPIEIAWGGQLQDIDCYLINPDTISHWTDWNTDAEAIHGINKRTLSESGQAVNQVCARVSSALASKTIYCDAPDFDSYWLNRLYEAANLPVPNIQVRHIDELLYPILKPWFRNNDDLRSEIEHLKYMARVQAGGQHRADVDVRYLILVWQITQTALEKRFAH